MNAELTVFVFRKLDRNPLWVEKCLSSLVHPLVEVRLVGDLLTPEAVHAKRFVCANECDTPYFCFVDDDDWIDTEHIDPMIRLLKDNPSAGGLFTDEVLTNAEGVKKGMRIAKDPELSSRSAHKYPMDLHHLVIVSTSIARQAGSMISQTNYKSCEVLLYGLVASIAPLLYYQHPVYYWRKHKDSTLITKNDTIRPLFARARQLLTERFNELNPPRK